MNLLRNFCKIKRIFSSLTSKPTVPSEIPKRCFCEKVLDINTNVKKDVILYKYINDRYFKIANLFSICQFSFWSYLAIFAFSTMKDAPVEDRAEQTVWWRKINLGENKYKNTLSLVSFGIGFGILAITWMYTLRSVKYIILRKGGQKVSIVTHTPFGENRILTLDLKYLNCKQMRTEAKSQLPIKVKGHSMHYMLDMRGEFKHPQLFDMTCGLARNMK